MEGRDRFDAASDLEARQDEVLVRLDELERRVEKVLAEWVPGFGEEGQQKDVVEGARTDLVEAG